MSDPKPLTSDEAEALARETVKTYLNACHVGGANPREAIGNYLMKLCSVAGVAMAHAEGSETAAARLFGTGQFIATKMPAEPARLEKLQ
ncbi:hypothetical protein ABXN37_19645 [Piscinibacter sakaiensis]|uniref:Uncharacterized protein n=1 Tax=Piscinibacter sakaiensis TaxID=1547922 RepID=A0A0K8P564_PISS1|nr:hypothetical protein [Piscinibacter sakaiensis]GAP37340.1 hypothetical protein ISF6_3195 [Piscinibacter sakaiensis]